MPTFPKYSDRINFFFVVFGKPIPVIKEIEVLSTIRSQFSPSASVKRDLARANSVVERVQRFQNINNLSIAGSREVEDIRRALEIFFAGAQICVSRGTADNRPLRNIWDLTSVAVRSINRSLEHIDNTWLENYGVISKADLELKNAEEFFKMVIPVAHKFICKTLKPLVKELKMFEKPVHAVHFLTLRRRTH